MEEDDPEDDGKEVQFLQDGGYIYGKLLNNMLQGYVVSELSESFDKVQVESDFFRQESSGKVIEI